MNVRLKAAMVATLGISITGIASEHDVAPANGIGHPMGWQTKPWPDGAILGKVVWKDATLEDWPAATAPGEFVHAEFMFKDSERYSNTHGWGWARWVGLEQVPFDEGMQACISCHTPVKDRDWVFTDPAAMPKQ